MKNGLVFLLVLVSFFQSCKSKDSSSPISTVIAPISTTSANLTTFAGIAGSFGALDGEGTLASFYFPYGVTSDSSGNIFVTDNGNNTIRKITAAGIVSTFAGTAGAAGSLDGAGMAARFNNPKGIASDSSGNIYVVDSGNHTIRKITSAGIVTTFAGTAGMFGSTNSTGVAARFFFPNGISIDGSGNLYVSDTGNHIIRKITNAGVVTTLAGTAGNVGSTDALTTSASFNNPKGIAIDGSLNLYVSDSGNHTIRKITNTGVVTTLAGLAGSSGSSDANGSIARFNNPNGIAIDSSGNICVVDVGNNIIRKIVSTSAAVTTLIGSAGNIGASDGAGASASLSSPNGVSINTSGHMFISDTGNFTIRKIKP